MVGEMSDTTQAASPMPGLAPTTLPAALGKSPSKTGRSNPLELGEDDSSEAQIVDRLLFGMEAALLEVDDSQGSKVGLQRAELHLLEFMGRLRDALMASLQSGCGEDHRRALQELFGGDCVRISRLRAVLDSVTFSEASSADQRSKACLNACESVERVLADLGLGSTLCQAQLRRRQALMKERAEKAQAKATEEARLHPREVEVATRQCFQNADQQEAKEPQEKTTKSIPELVSLHRSDNIPHLELEDALQPAAATAEVAPLEVFDEQGPLGHGFQDGPTKWLEKGRRLAIDLGSDDDFGCDTNLEHESKATPVSCVEPEPCEDVEATPESCIAPESVENIQARAPTPAKASARSSCVTSPSKAMARSLKASPPTVPKEPPGRRKSLPGTLQCKDLESGDGVSWMKHPSPSSLARRSSMEVPQSRGSQVKRPEPLWEPSPEPAASSTTREEDAATELRKLFAPPSRRPAPSTARAARDLKDSGGRSTTGGSRKITSARGNSQLSHPSTAKEPVSDAALSQVQAEAKFRRGVFNALSLANQALLRQIFAHYVGPAGLASGAGLSLARFRQALREAGLLAASAGGEGTSSVPGLPLPMFQGPTLSPAEADLMLFRAAGTSNVGEATSTGTPTQSARRLHTVVDFARALANVAAHCFPERESSMEAIEALCDEVLATLGQLLPEGKEVLAAASLLAEPGIAAAFRQGQQGLATVFARYASGQGLSAPYERGHWTVRAISRFASEANLIAEMSHPVLQRLFFECTLFEAANNRGVEGKLSFSGFQVIMMAIAQRAHEKMRPQPVDRIALLFLRLSSLPGAQALACAARASLKR